MQHKLFSIILFILLTTEITGQVVIKEKVNLTESVPGTGQQSIVTQYYADIAVTIYWVPAIAKLVQTLKYIKRQLKFIWAVIGTNNKWRKFICKRNIF